MKKRLLFVILGLGSFYSAQNNTAAVKSATKHNYSINDTIPEVVNPNSWEIIKPLFELNNTYTTAGIYPSLNPQSIESLKIEQGTFNLNQKKYSGKIKLTLKPTVKMSYITVTELIVKYTNLKDGENYIYSIDGEIILENPKSSLVDEKNIMQIKVYPLEYLKEYKNFKLVKILTRTEKNIAKANEILIR